MSLNNQMFSLRQAMIKAKRMAKQINKSSSSSQQQSSSSSEQEQIQQKTRQMFRQKIAERLSSSRKNIQNNQSLQSSRKQEMQQSSKKHQHFNNKSAEKLKLSRNSNNQSQKSNIINSRISNLSVNSQKSIIQQKLQKIRKYISPKKKRDIEINQINLHKQNQESQSQQQYLQNNKIKIQNLNIPTLGEIAKQTNLKNLVRKWKQIKLQLKCI